LFFAIVSLTNDGNYKFISLSPMLPHRNFFGVIYFQKQDTLNPVYTTVRDISDTTYWTKEVSNPTKVKGVSNHVAICTNTLYTKLDCRLKIQETFAWQTLTTDTYRSIPLYLCSIAKIYSYTLEVKGVSSLKGTVLDHQNTQIFEFTCDRLKGNDSL
jgi:hypothetical protein